MKLLTGTMALMIALTGCKKAGEESPPIAAGKCVVDSYFNGEVLAQTCVYQGYVWNCTKDSTFMHVTCKRLGEALGERIVVDGGAQ